MPIAPPIGTARYARRESGLLARCSFNVADSATLLPRCETGQAWNVGDAGDAATLPTFGVTAGRGVGVAAGTQNDPHAWIESNASDGIKIGCLVGVATSASALFAGILFRRQDANNYLYLRMANSADSIAIFQNLATVRTTATAGPTFPTVDGQVVRVEIVLQGPLIRVLADGAQLFTATNANFLGATKHGIAMTGAGTGASWKEFRVETL